MNFPPLALKLLALLALGLTSCRAAESSATATAGSTASRDVARDGILPMPSGPLELTLAGATGISLDELLTRLSKLTGVTYSAVPTTKERLKATTVALSQDQRIPANEVYPWVESLLQQSGYSLAVLENAGAPLVGVYARGDPNSRAPAINLDATQLHECRMHPATFFSTVLTLPDVDVRSLGNSLRILAPDTASGGVIPVGTTNSVILSATGRDVADLAAMLLNVQAEAKKKKEAAGASAAAQQP